MTDASNTPSKDSANDLPEQLRIRREKRARILESGRDAYPVEVPRTHTLAEIRAGWQVVKPEDAEAGVENKDTENTDGVITLAPGEETDTVVGVAGRVMFIRNTGKLAFATLQEGDGTSLQVMLSLAAVGEDALAEWKADVDMGDMVFVEGRVISSKRGELSVMANRWFMTSKSLRPLPVAHKEMSEDTRVRHRYTDLIMREQARENAMTRIKVMRSLRNFLESRGFLEVETPMLQTLHGGAAARPFETHSNALDIDLYLRIAPELFLKRCVVGGIDRVFEVNRNFRNEGVDSSHSPEFAMLETYQAYGTYDDGAKLHQDLVQYVAKDVFGSTTVTLADGTEYDLGGEWKSIEMYPSLNEALQKKFPGQPEVTTESTVEELKEIANVIGLSVPAKGGWGHGKLVEEIWELLCEDQLEGPIFVRDFPVETSPLTRDHRSKAGVTEKWDLYVRGFELSTGYSELIDPVIQRERFEDQARLAAGGDDEAMVLDEDFLAAMEQGMPPTSGTGMGVDRLLMALTGLGIRETILFPMVRPERES
ncbi:lysine--tRNA ligase [Corynebacterium suicordis]|uniref:Lysine--tRNA ligase n=1 Tax=Corynebacterium suicordis DSM 45110 TaxID=1121369 RepID=A0ABR9ZMM7_9CORY|nr:lysine--tRNA ligase [Corynebacterium suicordis]MBF4554168.1 lysine--tRNA ligase [Corynebacterium suicordis DSM 45110]MDR6276853.1 lysyl-tRNA synthetase class 2 [Corynebacterium suicordis]